MTDTKRIDELEIRSAHQDQMLGELNDVIAAQWKKIEQLEFLLKRTREELQNINLRPEGEEAPPPHY
ncbi:SlyX family protein [Aestuariivirga litoralis]|uniref:SlyX family protein n=1 Tax=Aestuariivirga litoralis TaxID=2650924 RepID=UPI0018C60054|nr:SlyX family protein [Aestuariivirga litoralis]MBG1231206.1 SlyX family protein [Aestuariivirga litoralis]